MNRKKWTAKDYPPSVWLAKVAEEFGEVAEIFSEPDHEPTRDELKHAIEELEHLRFIAGEFQFKLECDLQLGVRNA